MGTRRLLHGFDGYAKLSSFDIRNSHELLFSSRFIQSQFYTESVMADDIAKYVLIGGTKPAFSFTEKLQTFLHGMDNPNVNIQNHQNTIFDEF